MTTTTAINRLDAWWDTSHDHSLRCWWNWEVGRWVCSTGDISSRSSAPTAITTDPTTDTTDTTEDQA